MNRRIENLLQISNYLCVISAAGYIYGMLVYPFYLGGWKNAHAVWLEWQSLNVGVLAFGASVIAFNISRYHANQQRNRELIAARSFLPHALSELTGYLKECSSLLEKGYEFAENNRWPGGTVPVINAPRLPDEYAKIFEKCISLSDPPVADHLSHILMKLQINQARLGELAANLLAPGRIVVLRANIVSYFFRVGELQCLINSIFPYSRGEEDLQRIPLTWEEFRNAFGTHGIWVEEFDDLEGFTRRAIERNRDDWKID